MASYPLGSLAGRDDLRVTSVSGTRDGLATPADIEASRADLPASATFVAVVGAVHAFFGDYGTEPGDGSPTVSRREAQEQIADASIEAGVRAGHSLGRSERGTGQVPMPARRASAAA